MLNRLLTSADAVEQLQDWGLTMVIYPRTSKVREYHIGQDLVERA